jgi:4-hydroxy-4-methyl-2-oxoglutarate aldolase
MKPIVVVDPPRTPIDLVDKLATLGVATVHEAIGRRGYLGPSFRPIYPGARIAGTAVTVLVAPGDNFMAHVAVEQTGPGDILVVVPTSPCTDGYFGELFATALQHRGVRGIVTDTGIRDVAELTGLGFPAWTTAVSAQGTVKATAGAVNVPIVVGGVYIEPGDVIIADDDGVVSVPRAEAEEAIAASEVRIAKEAGNLEAFRRGEISLDVNGLRPLLEKLGVEYVKYGSTAQ